MTEPGRAVWHKTMYRRKRGHRGPLPRASSWPRWMHLHRRGHKPRICRVPCDVYSRIVGYLRPLKNWNVAKQQEFEERVTYGMPEMDQEAP